MSNSPVPRRPVLPLIVIGLGVVLLIVTAVLALSGRPAAPAGEVERVALEEARQAHASGAAVFVDVRGEAAYAEAHIAGARLIPLAELEQRLGELDPNDWIITYCT
jgi:hypothetical protein